MRDSFQHGTASNACKRHSLGNAVTMECVILRLLVQLFCGHIDRPYAPVILLHIHFCHRYGSHLCDAFKKGVINLHGTLQEVAAKIITINI